jgi:lysozyme
VILSLREQLIRDEELRLRVYNDSLGVPTIGVGRNLRDKGISPYESDLMLNNDIAEHTIEVLKAIPFSSGIDEIRFEVLVNMSFNMGTVGLLGFVKFLAALKAGNYTTARTEMLNSKWAAQVGARATRLSQQILLDVRQ